MKLGSIVTLKYGNKAGRPHVVVHEPVGGRVKLCHCGSARWYVPEWHPLQAVVSEVQDGAPLRRCRRLLAEVKPDPDGWKRIEAGRRPNTESVIVGHVDLDQSGTP